jgi:hypothetical protein
MGYFSFPPSKISLWKIKVGLKLFPNVNSLGGQLDFLKLGEELAEITPILIDRSYSPNPKSLPTNILLMPQTETHFSTSELP